MSSADSTLMMLLSLNLLLLVFFMLLNSMATYGKRHADEVLAQVRQGYEMPGKGASRERVDVPEVPMEAWRNNVVARMQGVIVNRLDLRVLPQQGNAGKVEMTMPLAAMFDREGTVLKPELVGNLKAAAGSESQVTWQVAGTGTDTGKLAMMAANLARIAGKVDVVRGSEELVKIGIVPGIATRSGMGLQIQAVGEEQGAKVQGVDERGGAGE